MNIIIRSDDKIMGNDNNFQYQLNFSDVNLLHKNYKMKINSVMIYPAAINRNFNNKYFYEVSIQNLGGSTILDETEQSKISFFIPNETYGGITEFNNLNFTLNSLNPYFYVSILDNTGAELVDNNNVSAKIVMSISLEEISDN